MSVEETGQTTAETMDDEKTMSENQKSPKKSNKPQMEKKRRERINNSLDELKLLILGAMKKDASYYSKLEKADILEMAVDHVRNLQKQIHSVQTAETDPMAKYRAGFVTCASEVTRMIMGFPGLDESVKFNVMKHLANCCTVDQRATTKDTKVKQEISHDPIRGQEIRPEPIRSQVITSSIAVTDTTQSQMVDSRTVGEKRILYQNLLNRSMNTRKTKSPDRISHVNSVFDYRKEEPKLRQFSPTLKTNFIPSVAPWTSSLSALKTTINVSGISSSWVDGNNNNINKNNTLNNNNNNDDISFENSKQALIDTGFNVLRSNKSEGNLIKPVPQMPEKMVISGGIRFMPATVLVPVQVGYAPFEYRQKSMADEKGEVWRPWEKMEHLSRNKKTVQQQGIFSL